MNLTGFVRNLNITPQAVSDYIAQLTREEMLISQGRSSYKITNEGVDFIIKTLKDLSSYNTFIQNAVSSISVCTAIAESDLEKGQKVALKMKDGLLLASKDTADGATGIAVSSSMAGEDVGVTSIEGIVPLEMGKVTILKVPAIQRGGSRKVDLERLREHMKNRQVIASIGLESSVALRKAGTGFYQYGAAEAAIEAAKSGLSPLVVCVENDTADLIARLEKDRLPYELFDVEKA